jgi:hypothetical protein
MACPASGFGKTLESQCSPSHSQQRSRHKAHAQLQPDHTALATAARQADNFFFFFKQITAFLFRTE